MSQNKDNMKRISKKTACAYALAILLLPFFMLQKIFECVFMLFVTLFCIVTGDLEKVEVIYREVLTKM